MQCELYLEPICVSYVQIIDTLFLQKQPEDFVVDDNVTGNCNVNTFVHGTFLRDSDKYINKLN